MQPVYATKEDWRQYRGLKENAELPQNLDSLLNAGSLAVREYTALCVYPVDGQGLPTGRRAKEAMRDATCAHATAMLQLDIDPDRGGAVDTRTKTSKSINGASITYNKNEQDSEAEARLQVAQGIAPTARRILDAAGMSGGSPWLGG
ncbi:hypothetical protein OZX57_06495 [Bifidobacterium sp. ESL0682]|uniref:hypothetical protein n=1 Tax=Bifidobacterium sp. ESL0682 TaxID=2983212 RepID=UPI0023F7C48D|nr:hypothetical protein [Bifidobacterium sp. ESL0682]WEV41635.1 hypothetical protein OZX57_06495 [Bifidobacterium sp. ESL0682]